MKLATLLKEAQESLLRSGITNGRLEAEWLLTDVLQCRAVDLLLRRHEDVEPVAEAQFLTRIARRASGEPLQYIMGSAEFMDLTLKVGPGVLVPRPETECLVEAAAAHYPGHGRVCDLCTGSGAIALALARRLPPATEIVATDLSPAALEYAEYNREQLGLAHVRFYRADLFAPLPGEIGASPAALEYTLITANPPYVSEAEYAQLPPDVRDHEPRTALFAEDAGLAVVRRIAHESRARLGSDGWLFCEIGSTQGDAAARCFEEAGWKRVEILRDFAGKDRIIQTCMEGRRAPTSC